jgi:hypothetical protein
MAGVGVCHGGLFIESGWDWEEQDPDPARARAILPPISAGGGDEILDPGTGREEPPDP